MKKIAIVFLTFFCTHRINAQEVIGLRELLSAKNQIEDVVRLIAEIPDTASLYKKNYTEIRREYLKVQSDYDKFRGSLSSCINQNKNPKKMMLCLDTVKSDFEGDLKILAAAIENLYDRYNGLYIPPVKTGKQSYNSISEEHNLLSSSNIATTIADIVVDAGLKIWKQIKDLQEAERNRLLKYIESDEYKLASFELLSRKKT